MTYIHKWHNILMSQLFVVRFIPSCPQFIVKTVQCCTSSRLAAACTSGWMFPIPRTTTKSPIYPSRLLTGGSWWVTAPLTHLILAKASPAVFLEGFSPSIEAPPVTPGPGDLVSPVRTFIADFCSSVDFSQLRTEFIFSAKLDSAHWCATSLPLPQLSSAPRALWFAAHS